MLKAKIKSQFLYQDKKNSKYKSNIIIYKFSVINQQKHSRNNELYSASRSEHNDYYNKNDIDYESISFSKNNMPEDYFAENPSGENQSGIPKEEKSKLKNQTEALNSLCDKDLSRQLNFDIRLNKINNKMNSIVKGCVPTNPSTVETELGS